MKELNWKKVGMYSALALVVIFVLGAGLIVYDSREYFSEYFEVKRTKLNLMTEKSADSLQNEIIIKQKNIDSLNIVITENKKSVEDCQKINIELMESNRLLQKTIEHQNSIIEGFGTNW
ncbi:hypothetical protein M0Q97_12950 [Candidatus Dojkabacteria bacterium]|nr:hypothetical protein [Candidatus Dojkabacteria bacterium]